MSSAISLASATLSFTRARNWRTSNVGHNWWAVDLLQIHWPENSKRIRRWRFHCSFAALDARYNALFVRCSCFSGFTWNVWVSFFGVILNPLLSSFCCITIIMHRGTLNPYWFRSLVNSVTLQCDCLSMLPNECVKGLERDQTRIRRVQLDGGVIEYWSASGEISVGWHEVDGLLELTRIDRVSEFHPFSQISRAMIAAGAGSDWSEEKRILPIEFGNV